MLRELGQGLAFSALLAACGSSATPATQDPVLQAGAPAPVTTMGAAGTGVAAAPPVTGQSTTPPVTSVNHPTAAGGGPAVAPVAGTSGAAVQPTQPAMQPQQPAGTTLVGGEPCGLTTTWAGDQYCIKPPPADKGFQLHVGPTDYTNPGSQWVMQPGAETTETFPATTGNTTDVMYYFREYRMRPGSHHMILYANGMKRLGGSQNLSKDNPENGVIAPENMGIGMKLAAKTPVSVNLHYMNYTDKPILKEVWVNFWYRDPKDVTQPANELFSLTPMNVAPMTHVLIHSDCAITQPGRIVTLYGHRHANNIRFAAWRTRGSQKDLIFDDYDWLDPLILEYSSTVKNTPPDPANKVPGGWSGPLDLMAGDKVSFECDIVNMTNSTFRGQNEAKNDEMCILVGDTVGTTVPGFCTSTTTPQ
jgi:hypothetical protein